MFKSYIEFILKNAENPNITKDIIYINQKMLYRLNKKNYISSFVGGDNEIKKNNNFNHRIELDKFKKSTISIIESLEDPIKKQQEIIKKAEIALKELIKYIDLLYAYVNKEDLEKISFQLKELKEKINEY
jgi:hypothetical protein